MIVIMVYSDAQASALMQRLPRQKETKTMIQCPKCGAMNPDGFRNCKECYHPFGLERALNEMGTPAQPPPPRQNIAGIPSVIKDPVSGKPAQVLAVRPICKIPTAFWVVLAVLFVTVIFAVAWFLTHTGSGSGSYLEGVFENMERLNGWEADIRVDSSEYPVDAISFYLGGCAGVPGSRPFLPQRQLAAIHGCIRDARYR
jgi:ribosomal protein L40E